MSLKVGIIGLPNVGKSTLFNALTNLSVEAANYPFATIEPNTGVVPVPDPRLAELAKIENSKEIIPTIVEFDDIAGLVAGAHKGEGLGNKFLSHIREVDAVVQVVRFFSDENVIHVDGSVDPKRDLETISTELALADLEHLEKKYEKLSRSAKSGDKDEQALLTITNKYLEALKEGNPANAVELDDNEKKFKHEFPLLTLKPMIYLASIEQGKTVEPIDGKEFIAIDAKLEVELSQLDDDERGEYLAELGLKESGLDHLIRETYKLLDLITFFTAGEKETRAWTCKKGSKAPKAAGVIHTDFEKGFIKAEIIDYDSLISAGSYSKARNKGLIRTEGKEYVVQDGDVVHFRFNI